MKSQVLMGENLDKTNEYIKTRTAVLDAHIEKIDIRLAEATGKLNALINFVNNHMHDDKRHN